MQSALAKAQELVRWINAKLDGIEMKCDQRHRVPGHLFDLALEHHAGIIQLLTSRVYSNPLRTRALRCASDISPSVEPEMSDAVGGEASMRIVRWLLVFPGAIAGLVIGSFVGGMVASVFGQAAADTGSAFAGPFAFVFAACMISPAHRQRVALATAAVVVLLALGTVILSSFTTLEAFSSLSTRERVVTPVAQTIGALYGSFISLPVLTPRATLERLWREITALGSVVGMLGVLIALIGVGAGLAGLGWLGFKVGLSVVLLGAVTWAVPFMLAIARSRKARAVMQEGLPEMVSQENN